MAEALRVQHELKSSGSLRAEPALGIGVVRIAGDLHRAFPLVDVRPTRRYPGQLWGADAFDGLKRHSAHVREGAGGVRRVRASSLGLVTGPAGDGGPEGCQEDAWYYVSSCRHGYDALATVPNCSL
jgi:hypothetical protein